MDNLNKQIGKLLAEGSTSQEIVETLCFEAGNLTPEEAAGKLCDFYENWERTESTVTGRVTDSHRHWHVYMRHQLLKDLLESKDTKDIRTALAVLDSLAGIQGVDQKLPEGSEAPLQITLNPVIEKRDGR